MVGNDGLDLMVRRNDEGGVGNTGRQEVAQVGNAVRSSCCQHDLVAQFAPGNDIVLEAEVRFQKGHKTRFGKAVFK